MTRINSAIHPRELPSKLLLAEHREIKRIPNAIASGRFNMQDVPHDFTLGKGHVKFFYPRLTYLRDRYVQILDECKRRGYNVTDYTSCFDWSPADFDEGVQFIKDHLNQWCEHKEARREVLARIESKGFKLINQDDPVVKQYKRGLLNKSCGW